MPVPSACGFPSFSSVSRNSRSLRTQSGVSATGTGCPTTSAPCRPFAATVSASLNFQSRNGQTTISNPCAIQSTQARIAASSRVVGGADAKCSTISGSIRGSGSGPTGISARPP